METLNATTAVPLAAVNTLTKRYGQRPALQTVTFDIRNDEILGLIGPNGAGKTTLLECIAGVLPFDSGAVTFSGGADRPSQLFYLPDAISPWAEQTVAWALDFAVGFFRGHIRDRDEAVQDLHLADLLQSPVKSLSKGQRKRAMLAIALLVPRPILMIDEPFEGLDLRQSRELQAVLRKHQARGRTIFLSIHQIAEAAQICDRFVLLNDGKVAAVGTLAELQELAHVRDAGADGLEEIFLALT
jgi:ABC-type multidrug transport system ATPase subunit